MSLLFSVPLWLGCRRPPPPPPVQADPPPALPPLPELVLAFEKDLDVDPHPSAPAPATFELRWDLSGQRGYRVDQQILNRSTSRDKFGEAALVSSLAGEGYVEFVGSTARYKMSLTKYEVNGRPQDVNRQPAAKVEYALSEDGSVRLAKRHSGGDAQTVEVLFPLGSRQHERTGTYRETGHVTQTVGGFVLLRGRLCARLVTDSAIELSPLEADGSGIGRMRSRTIAYFDVRARCFVQSDAAVSFRWHSRILVTPQEGGPPSWTVGTLESHTILRARLE